MPRRIAFLLVALAGCTSAPSAPHVVPAFGRLASSTPIRHVVVIVQENRSFVDLFRGFPGADAPSYGYVGNRRIALKPIRLQDPHNIDNDFPDAIESWNHGKMNGFWKETKYGAPADYPYAYVPTTNDEAGPYWAIAKRWVLADRMFPTEFGASFGSHLDLIAANTEVNRDLAVVDQASSLPWDCDAPAGTVSFTIDHQRRWGGNGPFPCFTQFHTIADRLDGAGVSWRYYAPPLSNLGGQVWTTFGAFKSIRYGPDWKNVITPETSVLKDVKRGSLAAVTWVIPDFSDSDHTGSGSNRGPSWVASVVNAIGQSPFWRSTAIVIVWDDWGGWYDNVPPPQLDYRGLGIRVPCLVVSPYDRIATGSQSGYLSHTQYESGSILKFIEEVFGLGPIGRPSLGYTDTRANSLMDVFDFSQSPRPFVEVPHVYSASQILAAPHSYRPPDDD